MLHEPSKVGRASSAPALSMWLLIIIPSRIDMRLFIIGS